MNDLLNDRILEYVLAGKAIFTLVNNNTNNRITYKVVSLRTVNKDTDRDLWFVRFLCGSDNTTDYAFIGTIQKNGQFFYKHSFKSKIKEDAPAVKGIKYLLNKVQGEGLPEHFKVYHEGRCGRCGRTLTVPESIESGYGPECINLI